MKSKISFTYLKTRFLLNPKLYPYATMLFQSLATILVALEGVIYKTPDIYIDTTGAAFSYPIVWLYSRCYIISYVHYPIISTDMLQLVRSQRPTYNNGSGIATSTTVSTLKLIYYQCIAYMYSYVGCYSRLTMVNSSWTLGHIQQLWGFPTATSTSDSSSITNSVSIGDEGVYDSSSSISSISSSGGAKRKLVRVYPPCSITHLLSLPLSPPLHNAPQNYDLSSNSSTTPSSRSSGRKRYILSIGQFRPEKDHLLQLRAFAFLLHSSSDNSSSSGSSASGSGSIYNCIYSDIRLVLIGSVRHADDAAIVHTLKQAAVEMRISDQVDFVVNAPYTVLLRYLGESSIGK